VGHKSAVLIAGPTASGKSALALQKAEATGAIVVNADALQVYDGLRILTARPTEADMAEIRHRLYGVVPPQLRFSTGDWARAAAEIIAEAGDTPLIFVGGTGLYFEALTKGIAQVPAVSPEALAWADGEVSPLNREERGRLIAERDPQIAARLKAPDPQRVIRALAVLKSTGRSLASFQDAKHTPLLEGYDTQCLVLNPDREVLRARIAQRFTTMLEQGAAEEADRLLARNLNPTLPVMKAIGLREIAAWRAGRLTREAMIEAAIIATRQYAKRQRTWFRNRMADWTWREA
jgi:tRNA dimethylallyltransferase